MLKRIRTEKKITQAEAANILGISLRSYKSYENDEIKRNTKKYRYFLEKLTKINPIDEEHGIREIDDIKKISASIFDEYDIDFCYLFGSYAKNSAKENSDIDLLICSDIKGLKFYGLVEELREALHKKVDLLNISQLKDNLDLTKEILKDGIKIYG
ncbi:MAG: nucleotidyltransferase domain-containing protein [Lachnospiraceae bacterium]|nr:nucleotidyltransferase domain-containing protein [Lachnospiraceae bacterium]